MALTAVLCSRSLERGSASGQERARREREFFIDNPLVRIYFIIVMISRTGLAPWERARNLCKEGCVCLLGR